MELQQKYYQITYKELWEGETGLSFGVQELLFSKKSPYQQVQVWQTDAFGRILTLDGLVMITERDEFVYHEMITHPALNTLKAPKRVLVIGGGDGGTVREVLKHPEVEQVELVEIDQMVLDVAREFFPQVCSGFDDPRLTIRVEDGVAFVKQAPENTYDLIIVDSTDPIGIAEGLFGEDFYRQCVRILNDQGMLVAQTESPFDNLFHETIRNATGLLRKLFPIVKPYIAFIPSYPMGLWSFTLGSKRLDPVTDFEESRARAWEASLKDRLKYYNAELHRAAFVLPSFVRDLAF